MKKEDEVYAQNMADFGEFEPYVRPWCVKHRTVLAMPELKELFEAIQNRGIMIGQKRDDGRNK